MLRHAALAGAILLAICVLYIGVSRAGFCGYDDFNEAYRAAFFDGVMPSRIVTATHFTNFMYRPVTSALQLATWDAFDHAALGFRLRNLFMHLIAVVFVYAIGFELSRSRAIAAGAATAFGVNPYVNQSVVVAIWTNTTAYALQLAAFYAFLLACKADDDHKRSPVPALATSFVLALIMLFTYEPTIVLFGMMFVYLACCKSGRGRISRAFALAFGGGMAIDVLCFFVVRHIIGVSSAPLLPIGTIARDMLEYCIAVVLPIDPVLGRALFGVPLPQSGASFHLSSLYAPLGGIFAIVGAVAIGMKRPLAASAAAVPWRPIAFCLISIPLSLVPIAFFREHVSEFNLYIPAALYALAFALAVRAVVRDRNAFAAVVGIVVVFSAAGSWARNERVVACARIAGNILGALPTAAWRDGTWHVRLATAPDAVLSKPFGIYNYDGIDTLELVQTRIKGSEEAIRLATGNDRMNVDVVDAAAFGSGCGQPHTCFFVSPSGDVKEVSGR